MNEGAGCYRRPPGSSLTVGGLEVGIAGLPDIIERGLERMEDSDQDQKFVLLRELKARNYVPGSVQDEYMTALWTEFKKHRAVRKDKLEDSYQGIPRDEIRWFPTVDRAKCSGCSSCVEFCAQGVFFFVEGKSFVVRPSECIVGNSSCRSFCPEKAITFPAMSELKESLKALRLKHKTKA